MSRKSEKQKKPPFPTKAEILRFIERDTDKPTKREIARAFHIRGEDRVRLKALLRELEDEGLLKKGQRRTLKRPGALPRVTVIEIVGPDIDGELIAKPARWDEDSPPPTILVAPQGKRGSSNLGPGERALARLHSAENGTYEANILKRLEPAQDRVLGLYRAEPKGGRIVPTDRRNKHEYIVEPDQTGGAEDGELVFADIVSAGRNRLGLKHARVRERLGNLNAPRSTSLVAIHTHGIPDQFEEDTIAEAKRAKPVSLGTREDLRDVPLITIDPVDARDHDDAVWAEPDPNHLGGWHVIVAIADVAHYVRHGSALDRAAFERGNSVYFPDRVVPMLPDELSSDLCSLVPDQDRACLAAHMWFDEKGVKTRHKFVRGLMRSAANLSYEQVQTAFDGAPDDAAGMHLESVIKPLYGAYASRAKERDRRGPLHLDLPERKIELDQHGNVTTIRERERLDAHRLIEEFMIAANVAAAEELERVNIPCLYRVHEAPPEDRVESLREFLETLNMNLPRAGRLEPRHFNGILDRVAETEFAHLISTVVLRSQSQAYYGPANLGHFGLALERYAHFTSPIRRYSDIIVHRGLIRGLRLGDDGLRDDAAARLDEIGEHISVTERRAMAAERDATDRYMTAFMANKVGAEFTGRIQGVTRFGLFITLDETGADGFVPMRSLNDDFYRHVEHQHALLGDATGRRFRLGDPVTVKIAEATPVTGGLRFELLYDRAIPGKGAKQSKRANRPGIRRGKKKPGKHKKKARGS